MKDVKPYLTQREIIRVNLIAALEFHKGNRTHTARGLRIGIRTLQRHLKAAGLSNFMKNSETRNEVEIQLEEEVL